MTTQPQPPAPSPTTTPTPTRGLVEVVETPCSFFQIDGHRLDGVLHEPAGQDAAAGIVFAHGFGGTRGILAPGIARALAGRGGCAVLTFDYSGFGTSGGPRGRIDPVRQVRDCRAAVAWLRHERGLDGRVGVFGISLGGAVAVEVAATDASVPFAVGLNAWCDGERWMRDLRPHWRWLEVLDELRTDEVERLRTGTSRPVEPEWVMPRSPESEAFNLKLRDEHPERAFVLDVATVELLRDFRPLDGAHRLAATARALFVHCRTDCLVPWEHAADLAEATGGELLLLDGVAHYEVYEGRPFEQDMDAVHRCATGRAGPDDRKEP